MTMWMSHVILWFVFTLNHLASQSPKSKFSNDYLLNMYFISSYSKSQGFKQNVIRTSVTGVLTSKLQECLQAQGSKQLFNALQPFNVFVKSMQLRLNRAAIIRKSSAKCYVSNRTSAMTMQSSAKYYVSDWDIGEAISNTLSVPRVSGMSKSKRVDKTSKISERGATSSIFKLRSN